MNLFSRVNGFIGAGLVAASLLLAGCNQQPAAPAPLPPQVSDYGCPVNPNSEEMQLIFRGYYGVDGLSRPVNANHIPVDENGNCLSTAPVDVYMGAVSPLYVNLLYSRYHYTYVYTPGYVHIVAVPGSVYRSGVAPSGRVNVQTVAPVGHTVTTVTVRPGATQTVRPAAAPAAGVTVTPGATQTARPAAAPAAAAPAPAAITPPKAAPAAPSVFNRPAAAPAPSSFTPSRPSSSSPSVFRRK